MSIDGDEADSGAGYSEENTQPEAEHAADQPSENAAQDDHGKLFKGLHFWASREACGATPTIVMSDQ